MIRNPNYHQQPYLDKIVFRFYQNENELLKAARKGTVQGLSVSTTTDLKNFDSHSFSLPRYFAVFFNPDQSEVLTEKKVRQALNYATNRPKLVKEVLNGQGQPAYSPILPSIFNFEDPSKNYSFDLKKAQNLLKEAGFVDSTRTEFVRRRRTRNLSLLKG